MAGGRRAWAASGALVIRSSGLHMQILATAAYRTGHLVTEGKISLSVISHICRQSPDSNWSAGGQRAWMALGALVIRSSGSYLKVY